MVMKWWQQQWIRKTEIVQSWFSCISVVFRFSTDPRCQVGLVLLLQRSSMKICGFWVRMCRKTDLFLVVLLPAVDLASVLTPEVMAPILVNPEVQQRLMPYLPSGESLPQSSEELHTTLSSPQFQQVNLVSPFPAWDEFDFQQVYGL